MGLKNFRSLRRLKATEDFISEYNYNSGILYTYIDLYKRN